VSCVAFTPVTSYSHTKQLSDEDGKLCASWLTEGVSAGAKWLFDVASSDTKNGTHSGEELSSGGASKDINSLFAVSAIDKLKEDAMIYCMMNEG
jgi:hypothetical protein